MADVNQRIDAAAPPDEWLALSDRQRAELRRRANDYDPNEMEAVSWQEVEATIEPPPVSNEAHVDSPPPPTLDDAAQLASSLEPDDRMRLITRLWVSLPREQRAAVLRFQLDDFIDSPDPPESEPGGQAIWPAVWRVLFDPANTSQLYSAPQRFDLATIFVVTAAYSILFGGLTALDGFWDALGSGSGPLVKIVLGSIIAFVAAGQALLRGVVNPRGVSIVVGAATYTLFFLIFWFMFPRAFPFSFFTVVVLNGLILGAAVGYISGVLVGGVFLAADTLRGRLDAGTEPATEETPNSNAD